MYFLRPERAPGEKTGAPALPNRLLPFSFHFFRQFFWGCMGLLTLPVLGRAVFASIAYFESTLSGKIAHRTVLLPDQVLLLFDMMVFDFIPSGMFFVFVAALFYVANPMFCAAAALSIVVYFVTSLCLGRACAERSAANNEARAAVTGRIVDVITNIRNVFLFANQPLEDRELGRYTGEERDR